MCTLEKRRSLYILTIKGPGEHRLNPTLIDAIRAALNQIKSESTTSSSALITTAEGKFFSNGLDLEWTQSIQSNFLFMERKLRSLVSDLISLPMPTIAAITGHAAAGGLIFALSHGYVLMSKHRGFLYLSELDVRLEFPAWAVAVIECKVGKPTVRKEMVLRAVKFKAKEAEDKGIIDAAHDDAEKTVKAAIGLGEELVKRQWDGHVYSQTRMNILREVLYQIGLNNAVVGFQGSGSKL